MAEVSRRLSSMDFLDDEEYDELDRWGNREALTEPAGVSVSIPLMFAEQVGVLRTGWRCLTGVGP